MEYNHLNSINSPADLKQLNQDDLSILAQELRHFIINIVATKAGHLGASLGVVELTIALHYVFDTPNDPLVWDVGHQAYGHKLLTGRRDLFHTNRQLHGISGFPKMLESEFDAFGTGHSSTSISAVLGMAMASQLNGNNEKLHIAVIGDASIVSGMAFEGLNHAGATNANILIVLNDNSIGIDPSVGALKEYFATIPELKPEKDNFFEALNLKYSGPIDGHNLPKLIEELSRLKSIGGPKLLHIKTIKGKGLKQAEENQVTYHSPGKFDASTGELTQTNKDGLAPKFQDVFGFTLLELAELNEKIIGITPAMPSGSSLNLMMAKFPQRAFDVGIAEQHALTFAAGMAAQGFSVYCTIYSTFLQRAYDQLIHDIALQNIPVILCVDRAGLVGEDGATHHGIFDIAFLRCIPNLQIVAPSNEVDFRNILYTCQLKLQGPIAIRYPRGRGAILDWQLPFKKIDLQKGNIIKNGSGVAVLCVGTILVEVMKTVENSDLIGQLTIVDMVSIKPLDKGLLHELFRNHKKLVTIEEGVLAGGFGTAILEFANKYNYKNPIKTLGIKDEFIEHGSIEDLKKLVGLDAESIFDQLNEFIQADR